jgi:two-component system response regulator RegX3
MAERHSRCGGWTLGHRYAGQYLRGVDRSTRTARRRLPTSDDAGSIATDVPGRARLLLVEDEAAIVAPLVEGLEREGYDVIVARTGAEALALAADADLVLLDLGLPDVDGADICRMLRLRTETPIIVLTARGDELDRVLLLELGADDYVVKPFGFRELVARIRAVRRRTAGTTLETHGNSGRVRVIGELRIDHRARRVFIRDREIALTPKEFDLLTALAQDPGALVKRERLIEEVWDEHWWGPTKTLDVHVASLRKKLGNPAWISTVRGVGYRLEPAP